MKNIHSYKEKLIVSADDFGISNAANENILRLVRSGKIDRIGVMVHGKITPAQISELLSTKVFLDIHFDILHQFEDQRKKRTGALFRSLEFLLKFFMGKLSLSSVHKDWNNQIELFKKIFGKYPDGINSHEHVHFFPPFFKIAIKLQKRYAIKYIRFGDSAFSKQPNLVEKILHWMRKFNKKSYTISNCASSNYLISLDWIENLELFLKNLPKGKIELICHPESVKEFSQIKKYF